MTARSAATRSANPRRSAARAATEPELDAAAAAADDKTAEPAPGGPVALDLDTLEREGGTQEVFKFRLHARDWILADPTEFDWQDVVVLFTDPYGFFRRTLPADDVAEFFSHRIPAWKLNVLIERYIKHYGLPTPGEANA